MKRLLLMTPLLLAYLTLSAIDPMREYKVRPETYRLDYREVKIATEDDILLNTWIMPPSTDKKRDHTVILAGSDAGNMGFLLNYAFFLVREGFTVITFDYRGFGESSDFDHHPDFLYHAEYIHDFVSVLDWTKDELAPGQISVMAFSMGALVAVAGYSDSSFDFLVAEGFIANPQLNVARIEKLKGKRLQLPEQVIDYEQRLNAIDIPVLVFAGTKDQNTTQADAENFAKKAPEQRSVIGFDGDHLRGVSVLGFPAYLEQVTSFIGG